MSCPPGIARLRDASYGGLHQLLRRCALAVLTQGHVSDDPRTVVELFADFEIKVLQDRGIRLELVNAPANAFVDGRIIRGINELLFAVVRDIVFVSTQLEADGFDLDDSSGITHAVFDILRNARVLRANVDPNLVVCWGGHSISREEYEYTKQVGYQLGLRGHDICTGCGPGAMKGPMKGATIAHAKQRRRTNRYIGITEPGIIAAESPNPIVNNLVIMPDIEKRPRPSCARPTRSSCPGRRRHGGRSSTCSASCCIGQCRHSVPADLHRPACLGGLFRADRPFLRLASATRSPRTTRSS